MFADFLRGVIFCLLIFLTPFSFDPRSIFFRDFPETDGPPRFGAFGDSSVVYFNALGKIMNVHDT